jgi:hypothetical protein
MPHFAEKLPHVRDQSVAHSRHKGGACIHRQALGAAMPFRRPVQDLRDMLRLTRGLRIGATWPTSRREGVAGDTRRQGEGR